jgi:hypothetical protein
MGIDIHGIWQAKKNNKWVDISSEYNQNRNYQLFAILAGILNGYGLAGCVDGEPISPISEPRGLPKSISKKLNKDGRYPVKDISILAPWYREYYKNAKPDTLSVWFGDYSHSWVTGKEILDWFENAPVVVHTGVLNRSIYEGWDKVSRPSEYCGEVFGLNTYMIDDTDDEIVKSDPAWTHIRCRWNVNLKTYLHSFVDEVERLVTQHGKIRFVFGFDR